MNEAMLKKAEAAFKEILEKAKPKGMISEKELEDAFAEIELDAEKIEQLHDAIEDRGIDIVGDIEQEIKKIEISEKELEICPFRRE